MVVESRSWLPRRRGEIVLNWFVRRTPGTGPAEAIRQFTPHVIKTAARIQPIGWNFIGKRHKCEDAKNAPHDLHAGDEWPAACQIQCPARRWA
jgi:hypothetical protein